MIIFRRGLRNQVEKNLNIACLYQIFVRVLLIFIQGLLEDACPLDRRADNSITTSRYRSNCLNTSSLLCCLLSAVINWRCTLNTLSVDRGLDCLVESCPVYCEASFLQLCWYATEDILRRMWECVICRGSNIHEFYAICEFWDLAHKFWAVYFWNPRAVSFTRFLPNQKFIAYRNL